MPISLVSNSSRQTKKIARELAFKLIKKRSKKQALIIALEGELGSGKTTFIKGFSEALKVKEKILSPTFVIIHSHKVKTGSYFSNLYHIDAYRLDSKDDLLDLGIKEIFQNPKNIVLIEWADKVKSIIPKEAILVNIIHKSKNKRIIMIKNEKIDFN